MTSPWSAAAQAASMIRAPAVTGTSILVDRCAVHKDVRWYGANRPCFLCDWESWEADPPEPAYGLQPWSEAPDGVEQCVAEVLASGHWDHVTS